MYAINFMCYLWSDLDMGFYEKGKRKVLGERKI